MEMAVHDVDTGDEFDSGLISIAHSTTRREVRHGRPGSRAVARFFVLLPPLLGQPSSWPKAGAWEPA